MNALELKIAKKNGEVNPGLLKQAYKALVIEYIRHGCPQSPKGYDQDDVEDILNDYQEDPQNPHHLQEFKKLQEHRKICKATAKAELGITED
jgi:hypothetical protein